MAELRIHQLYSGRTSSTGSVSVYTVPSGKRAVLRSINVYNVTGSGNRAFVSLSSGRNIFEITLAAANTAGGSVNQQVWLVLEPGDVIQIGNANATAIDYILSGTVHFI